MYYITLSEWTIGFKSNPATNERHLRPLKLYAFSITLMRSGNFIDRNYREAVDSNSQRHRWFKLPICCRLRWLDRNFLLLLSLLICDNKLSLSWLLKEVRVQLAGKWLSRAETKSEIMKCNLGNICTGCAAIKLPTARLQKIKPTRKQTETKRTELKLTEMKGRNNK